MNVALLLGRGGSKSIPGKNVRLILGRPLVLYPMLAARSATLVDRVVVSTDCPDIASVARQAQVEVIDRPAPISADDAQMGDAITHALQQLGPEVEVLVTLHCNCATHPAGLLDRCIQRLLDHPDADSCVSGSVDRAVHPFRTRRLAPNGLLEPWMDAPGGTSSNRQALDPCVILDGAARAFRVSRCLPARGHPPFPYLGTHVLLEENPGGRDVHDVNDIILTEHYLRRQGWTEHTMPSHILPPDP